MVFREYNLFYKTRVLHLVIFIKIITKIFNFIQLAFKLNFNTNNCAVSLGKIPLISTKFNRLRFLKYVTNDLLLMDLKVPKSLLNLTMGCNEKNLLFYAIVIV